MTFSTLHIAATAMLTAIASLPVAWVMLHRRREAAAVTVLAGLATFGWRLVANVDALNADGINWVSTNDVLAGLVAYLILGMYAALSPPADLARFEKVRVAIAAITIAVNVIAI